MSFRGHGAGEGEPGAAADRRDVRVLLVEDEEAHAELIRRAFESRPGAVNLTVAPTLEAARSSLGESAPDLALIDLVLPDGKGIELLPAGGEEPAYPIVIMTSHGDEEVAVEAMRAGALNYVVKSPTTLTEMPQVVEGALREWGHIVERRRAEEALQASEEHFRSLIENAHDIITIIDEAGTIEYTSPAIERALGYASSERLGANYFELVHPEDRSDVIRQVLGAFAEPQATGLLEYRYRHRDGSVRILESVASPHRSSDGSLRVVINSRDVTDRKQLEDQLRHSQKWEIIGTLAGGIANEFNNMLTPILGFASLALNEATPGAKAYRRLEHILTAANRSKELAEQLLTFSRQSEPELVPIELHRVVDEAIKFLRPTLPPTIEIRQRMHTEQDTVMADPDQLHQVLMNLCTNAYHAMPEGGTLEVDLVLAEADDDEHLQQHPRPHEGTYVKLTVRDTGHGMDPDTKERVLEPFFTTKGSEKRSGLGLSVTHGIVVGYGGDLVVDSEPGQGTAVHVYLPLAAQA